MILPHYNLTSITWPQSIKNINLNFLANLGVGFYLGLYILDADRGIRFISSFCKNFKNYIKKIGNFLWTCCNLWSIIGIMFPGIIGNKTLEELLINKNYEYDHLIWTGFILFKFFQMILYKV